MAAVADVVVSGFDAAASALFDGAKRSLSHSAFPLPIESYFDPARSEGENARAFAVVVYAALRGLLADSAPRPASSRSWRSTPPGTTSGGAGAA